MAIDPNAPWLPANWDIQKRIYENLTKGKNKKKGKKALPGKKDPDKNPPASTSGRGYGGGGGGGGGGAAKGLDPYVQDYRLNFFPQGNPPAGLLKQAKDGNWSVNYWRMMVRRSDPNYFKSTEARELLPNFERTMKILFPGLGSATKAKQLMASPFYKRQALWYLKNGVGLLAGGGAEQLYAHLTETTRWNRNNPYWRAYARNVNAGVVAERNPLLYKQYLQTVKDSYAQLGIKPPDDYFRTFFSSKYASKEGLSELADNLKLYSQAAPSQAWFQGAPVTTAQTKTATLAAGAKGIDLRQKLAQRMGIRSSFIGSEQKGFQTALSEQGKIVNPNL